MKRKIFLIPLVLLVAVSPVVMACPPPPVDDVVVEPPIRIGFAHVSLAAPYFLAMLETAEDVAAEEGVELIWVNAREDVHRQVSQVMSLLAKDIDGLLINPVTPEGPRKAIEEAVRLGVPVVAIDRYLYGDFIAYVGIDMRRAGYILGRYIAKEVFPEGEVVMVELMGSPGCPARIGRGGGFHSAIEKYGEGRFTVFHHDTGYYSYAKGMAIMEDAIIKAAAAGVEIDLVFGHNDGMVLGAREALIEAGLLDVILCGVDAQREAIYLIKTGEPPRYVATVVNWSTDITRIGMLALIDYIRYGKLPEFTPPEKLSPFSHEMTDPTKFIKTGTFLIYEGNAAEYYDPDAIF